jgi:hypothetical protein
VDLANFVTDADGDALTFSLDTQNTDIFVVDCMLNAGSQLFCDLEGLGTTSLVATVSDGQATDTVTITINVFDDTNGNNAPEFSANSLYYSIDLALGTVDVVDLDTVTFDADGDELTYTLNQELADGTIVTCQVIEGSILNCDPNSVGTTLFTAIANDGQATTSIPVVINVFDSGIGQNNAPFYVNISPIEVEASGMQFIFDLQANSVDPDGDAVTNDFSLASTNPNIINYCVIVGTGQLYCNVVGTGQTQIAISVTDGIDTGFDVLPIIATEEPNNPPMFNETLQGFYSYEITLENVDVVDVASVVSDADGDVLTYTLDQSNTDVGVVSCQLQATSVLNCDLNGIGTTTVAVSVSDGTDTITAQLTINVYPGPQGPVAVISSPSDRIVCEAGESITFDGSQSFSPDNTTLVSYYWTVLDLAGNVVAQNTATTWTLDDCLDEGRYNVYLSVVDANNLVGDAQKLIRVYEEEDFSNSDEEGLKVSSVEAWGIDFEVASLDCCGAAQLELIAVVENQNDFDIDDLRMTYTIPEYGIKYRSEAYDIESGDMTTMSMVIDLPFDIEPGVYYPTFSFSDGEIRRVKPSYLEILG